MTATDNCDGTVQVSCTPGPITGTDWAKSQTFTYSAVDTCLNVTTPVVVTYTWREYTTAPVLANVPAGRHTVAAWHERADSVSQYS